MELFDIEKSWYKGNLHTHTTISDGMETPEECIRLYKEAGYDFLAITDHNKFIKHHSDKDFLLIDSTEFDINDYTARKAYHITGIGIKEEIKLSVKASPQDIINAIIEKEGLAIIAHPYWSLLTHNDLMELNSYHGIEIWNTVSQTDSSRGDSTSYADVLASKGFFPLLFAVDDTHFYKKDKFGGYIMVNSVSLDLKEIMLNIKEGNFYCSQAPQIKQICMENGKIHVETSEVVQISFITDTFYCDNRICRNEKALITEGDYEINPTDRVVRVECTDIDGKKAWSQLIRV